MVQLDTQVIPELEREGIARDFVRMVQQLRKEKDLDVSDRIQLTWSCDSDKVKQSLSEHKDYICDQVLATTFVESANAGKTEELGESTITFDVQRV